MALVLWLVHFTVPLAYYAYLNKCMGRPWNIKVDSEYTPSIVVIVPTYNEAALIVRKLEDIKAQEYPKEKLEIVVVDSVSTDGTADLARRWSLKNRDINMRVIEDAVRRGKIFAMNHALNEISESIELVVFTDADCIWRSEALRNTVKYFYDSIIGAVTCSIYPLKGNRVSSETVYRDYNNVIRIAESKVWSTPISHGPLATFRHDLLRKIGGIPTWGWADDSGSVTLLSFLGYRCIAVPDVVVYEDIPQSLRGNLIRKVRRARQLVHIFLNAKQELTNSALKPNKAFEHIFVMEKMLHVVNPWILVLAAILSLIDFIINPFQNIYVGVIIGALMICVFVSKTFRMWLLTQVILVYAFVKNLFGGSLLMWEPVKEIRVNAH